ncbi:deoxyribodipyrimidine photo-lyase [Moniliophthora roreri MCA 2997]|uniref:Deoxyribodipyrimidine photo-lyase n=1 Tax=Moniliophthora roreri (strain MCA 2997) TaxID=1381753 RepID=V2XNG1_MONRO|nr:deoxyribodipyrimidine photo-lyase [Moniliophthora roreri MCA 2997]
MKLVGKHVDKHGAGYVTLRPEDDEDIWHLYNLIQEGDAIRAPAIRRVQKTTDTGSIDSQRVRLNLTIEVKKVEFSSYASGDANQASGDNSGSTGSSTASLQIAGKVISENPHVKLGAFHTLDIETNRDIRIEKADGWDSIALSRVEESVVPGRGAEVGAVVCGEGVAAFCLLSEHMTIVTHRISVPVPRKAAASGTSQHEKALSRFYGMLFDAFLRHIPYSNVGLKAIVIASPGWVRDTVYDHMMQEASKRGDKILQKALREKGVKVHVSSPHVHSLVEVLRSPEIVAQLKETKFAREGIALDKFHKMLATDELRAWYGPDHVVLAADRGAIGTLLISDELFRSSNPETRKKYVALTEAVQQKGGEVVIFSSMHESGQQLNQLSGIAAILTFPLDVEVVEAEEEEERKRKELEGEEGLNTRTMFRPFPRPFSALMAKRSRISSTASSSSAKKPRLDNTFPHRKVAMTNAAAAVDSDPPLPKLLQAVKDGVKNPDKGECVVYWMRMADLRISDNRALSLASARAKEENIPLIVIFVISPQDYTAHDRGARRIDFTLRNLSSVKGSLAKLHIPLHTFTERIRKNLPQSVISLLADYSCNSLYANIEYEVDELRRDLKVCSLAKSKGIKAIFVHNKCIIEPGVVTTKENRAYAVYSPFERTWISKLNEDQDYYLQEYPSPEPNASSVKKSEKFSNLFSTPVPESVPGFELEEEDRKTMLKVWPAGEEHAEKILDRFVHTKSRSCQMGIASPLADGAEESDKSSRLMKYDKDRDNATRDTTSRLSPYLSAGVISVRACVRATLTMQKSDKVDGSRGSGIGVWVQELAWRDFYTNILTSFPRVSMGRPYLEKYAKVVWENHQERGAGGGGYSGDDPDPVGQGDDGAMLKAWKEGRTGVPIVDAAMRCIKQMGWVHNRLRMIVAMYLTKDLMIDWRVGERYFMQQLIDGDLASNNGGWQWSASTGVDPCPYFRIFNPYNQSTKADPSGEFIRHFVPELSKLRGTELHKPPPAVADKLGYPRAIVEHDKSRERALRRFKNPGEK